MEKSPITYFAETDNRNKRIPFGIKAEDRTRHVYVIGKTGMGKSTLLENMVAQDISNGNGFAFIDPHGKTAELLLDYIPQERIKDVIYFAPFDLNYPISFNVMEDVGYEKRHLVANGLMSAFKKIWVDAWSARMEYILNNILLALLEYPDSTLISVNRMLVDKEYRKKVVDNVTDPSVKAFWVDEYAKYTDRFAAEAAPAIQNKIGQFISNPLVRNIIGQPKSTFDFRQIMDEKKILIINLSKGRVGESNANLLGSMLITKIYLAAMSRADASAGQMKTLPNFYLYVDEFQSFANESFADILSEARKYKLNLTIAHQYIEQMSDEVRAAVFGNVGTMIVFRVGSFDAEVIEKEFFPTFTKEHIVNLDSYQIYLKLMIDGVASAPFSARSLPPIEPPLISFKEDIIRFSRNTYAKPREFVEDNIRKWHEALQSGPVDPKKGKPQDGRGNRNERPDQHGSLDDLKKFPKPPKKEARESELRKAIAMNYALNVEANNNEQREKEEKENSASSAPVENIQSVQVVQNQPSALEPHVAQQASVSQVQPQEVRREPQNILRSQNNKPHQSHPPKKDTKGPTAENLSALRNALSKVMTSESAKPSNPFIAPTSTSQEKSQEQFKEPIKPQPSQSEPTPSYQDQLSRLQQAQNRFQPRQPQPIPSMPEPQTEVPEEVLRRIFDIDR